ncbi:6965_t:CDS:2, partial [Dentiscutata erythropus]
NSSFSSSSSVVFGIYTVNSSNSSYPFVIPLDSATYSGYFSSDGISIEGSKPQVNNIYLERIQYQYFDTSSEQARFTKVASKSSQHRVKYFGLLTRILLFRQYSNADFPNQTTPYSILQITNMSTFLTTYTQVNKVSSTTVAGFLSGLGGSTAFLLVIYKFFFGGYKSPGLLKPFLPKEWTTMSKTTDEEATITRLRQISKF